MLHITNGDSAAGLIRQTGIGGEVLPWRDALHEGPVPAGLSWEELREARARYMAEQGWGDLREIQREFSERDAALASFRDHDEVVLWFEHDLYDQLQLIQLLDWFAQQDRGRTRFAMFCVDEYLGSLQPERLCDLFPTRSLVSEDQLVLGHRAWAAFQSPDPTAILRLLEEDTSVLPFLEGALVRHLQQFPSVHNGLSRSEQQALEVLAESQQPLIDVYVASHHRREERVFLGDIIFADYVQDLSRGRDPLVLFENGEPVTVPAGPLPSAAFWDRPVMLTDIGRDILHGKKDRIRTRGIDRWLGGVHLHAGAPIWRWNTITRQLEQE